MIFVYYCVMKKKCRILSIIVVIILLGAVIGLTIFIINKPNKKTTYAESIAFVSDSQGFELLISNSLIINDNMVTVTPNDCSFKPEFTIKKYNSKNEIPIVNNKHNFETSGRYIFTCKVKKSANDYAKDTILITVVDAPTINTNMYITRVVPPEIYVEDKINISSLCECIYPANAKLDIICDEYLYYDGEYIVASKSGIGHFDVLLTYDYITIGKSFSVYIAPKLVESDIRLELNYNGFPLTSNNIEVNSAELLVSINYNLTHLINQSINCWTDSNLLQINSYDTPIIQFKPLSTGTATIYVSPVNHSHLIFEIVVTII